MYTGSAADDREHGKCGGFGIYQQRPFRHWHPVHEATAAQMILSGTVVLDNWEWNSVKSLIGDDGNWAPFKILMKGSYLGTAPVTLERVEPINKAFEHLYHTICLNTECDGEPT